jgi:glycosyltransferase involved in cell wall biosynthesis
LSIPDQYIGWFPSAALSGIAAVRKHHIRVVFTTALPLTSHLVGLTLKKRFGLKWIADFRDIWPWLSKNDRSVYERIESRVVKAVLENADKITTVSDEMSEELRLSYPSAAQEKFHVITNGFDPEDYEGVSPARFDRFTILHAGEMYQSFSTGPDALLNALRELVLENRIGEDFRLVFLGSRHKGFLKKVDDVLSPFIELRDPVPHDAAISHMLGADALLLLIGDGDSFTIGYTSKFFEYMFAKRPILAISPGGPVSDLIRRAGVGFCYRPDEKEGIKQCLLDLYSGWKKGELATRRDETVVAEFSRKALTGKLAGLLDEVSAE